MDSRLLLPGVAGPSGPVAVTGQTSRAVGVDPCDEGREGVAVPLLQEVAGQGGLGAPAPVGEQRELADQGRVLPPADGHHVGGLPAQVVVQPPGYLGQPLPQLGE